MTKTTPAEYLRQVRLEMKKVTFPSRKEVVQSTIAVFVMVTLAAVFLFIADQAMSFLVGKILELGTK